MLSYVLCISSVINSFVKRAPAQYNIELFSATRSAYDNISRDPWLESPIVAFSFFFSFCFLLNILQCKKWIFE